MGNISIEIGQPFCDILRVRLVYYGYKGTYIVHMSFQPLYYGVMKDNGLFVEISSVEGWKRVFEYQASFWWNEFWNELHHKYETILNYTFI